MQTNNDPKGGAKERYGIEKEEAEKQVKEWETNDKEQQYKTNLEEVMKKHSKLYSALAVMAITAMMATSPCFADDAKTTTMGTHNNEFGTMKGGYSILGSKLIGMEVENPQGDNLGEVKDIMIDSTGKVRYAAVSYGGIMGMGDKMYAVPLEAFTFKRDKDMFYDDVKLILSVTKEQLKDVKGFDNKNWPNLDDEGYRKDLETRYNIKRNR